MKKILLVAALFVGGAIAGNAANGQGLPSTDTRAVPTYESVGLYWSNSGANAITGCEVKYRRSGDSAWNQGLAMWLDARNNECRGSLVQLSANTDYEVQFNLPGLAASRAISFRTWPNQRPVARTVTVAGGSATLDITQGGSPTGYIVYQAAPGAVLDAANASPFNVTVNASYVIVRGFVLKGAQQDGVRISPNVSDVIIEDNEITGWGRQRTGIYGVEHDSAIHAVCSSPTLQRVTVQRNEIHDPRYTTNSWSDGHPQGPQGVTFDYCGGNHVIRHNEIFSTTGRYYNDIIGGADNDSTTGFPNADSDIYGNELSSAWDDAIEAEGGNRNVRIWGNYIDQTGTGIASTITSVGPLYMFRNVYNRSRMLQSVPLDQDDRQVMFKSGSDAALGDGRRYVFHNTMLQATQAGAVYGLGASGGISGTGATQLVNNTVSRNNIFQNWRTWTAYYDVGVGNDFAYDLFNGSAGAPVVGGITGVPIYAPGNGWQSEANGMYQLASNSPGYDRAVRIPNFNDSYTGAAPDVGAHEAGTAAMKFGIAASPGPAAGSSGQDGSGADTDKDGVPDSVEPGEGLNPAVKDNDVFASARLFAMQQYRDFLNREGDPTGVGFWTNQVNSGASTRAQEVESFCNSAEFQNTVSPVTRLYFAYFLRIPDYAGLQYWINFYKSGHSLDEVSNAFAGSAEFASRYGALTNAQYVTLVYQNVLGRNPDSAGLAYWTNQLNTAANTRGQVMLGFSESAEYKSTSFNKIYVTMMYVGMLRRVPDQAGFDYWVGYLNGGSSGIALISGFLAAAEYRNRFLP